MHKLKGAARQAAWYEDAKDDHSWSSRMNPFAKYHSSVSRNSTDRQVYGRSTPTDDVRYWNNSARNDSYRITVGHHTPTTEFREIGHQLHTQASWSRDIPSEYLNYRPAEPDESGHPGTSPSRPPAPRLINPLEHCVLELEGSMSKIRGFMQRWPRRAFLDADLDFLERLLTHIHYYEAACQQSEVVDSDEIAAPLDPHIDRDLTSRYQACITFIDIHMTIFVEGLTTFLIQPMWEWIDEDPSFEDECNSSLRAEYEAMQPEQPSIFEWPSLREALIALSKLPGPQPAPAGLAQDPSEKQEQPSASKQLHYRTPTSTTTASYAGGSANLRRTCSILEANPGWR